MYKVERRRAGLFHAHREIVTAPSHAVIRKMTFDTPGHNSLLHAKKTRRLMMT